MTVSELLDEIRADYVRILTDAVHRQPAYIEAAYRQANGTLATEGILELPCRADFILQDPKNTKSSTVDSTTQRQFEVISFNIGATFISLSPFVWDWAPVEIIGLSPESASVTLKNWFLRWFDADDQNNEISGGLFGVVHFMSDLEFTHEGVRVRADLGSAPAEALEDLMFSISDSGASKLFIG